ncbi:uncharacterized protein LOC132315770 [Cornus florida]|uniref:uncharacterized protein LOC132315770 n=1 Tax=Cornus florida TaxID=4283 RepID=UPI002899FC8F|nr:uncharacterized protein LOC132315770 [Cornus florida]
MEEYERQKQQEMQEKDAILLCPSFNSYSSHRFAEIAARVGEEFSADEAPSVGTSNDLDDNDDDDFEFSLVRNEQDGTGDEIFFDGHVHPIFPIFNRTLVESEDESKPDDASALRIPLKKLFMEDREIPSSSESEADELETIPPGTYCVWRPKVVELSPDRCKKSSSTGSASKRWRFLSLLRRSNSEGIQGKDAFVFLTPKNRAQKVDRNEKTENTKEGLSSGTAVRNAGKLKSSPPPPSAHETFYVRTRAMKEGDKRKSYLPYRQDLVGFFANVNGLSRTFPTF